MFECARNLLLCCLLLVPSIGHSQHSRPDRLFNKLQMGILNDPTVPALTLELQDTIFQSGNYTLEGNSYKRHEIGIGCSGLIPMQYHPEGIIKGHLSWKTSWILRCEQSQNPSFPDISRTIPNFGGLNIVLGEFEIMQDSLRGFRKVSNLKAGLEVEQEIPYTDISIARQAGTLPILFNLGTKYVRDHLETSDTTYLTGEFHSEWQLCILSQNLLTMTLVPFIDLVWAQHQKTHVYFKGVISLTSHDISITKFFGDSRFYARFYSGEQSPDFVQVNNWEFGIGKKILFDSKRP